MLALKRQLNVKRENTHQLSYHKAKNNKYAANNITSICYCVIRCREKAVELTLQSFFGANASATFYFIYSHVTRVGTFVVKPIFVVLRSNKGLHNKGGLDITLF